MSQEAASLFSLAHLAKDSIPASREATGVEALPHVGQHAEPLTDEAREEAIKRAGELIEKHMAIWDRDGCFAARGDAERVLRLQTQLIQGRSKQAIARMERERGLA